MSFQDDMPLGEARDRLRPLVMGSGAHCPLCTQFAKRYDRKLNSGMAVSLIRMFHVAALGDGWVHVPTQIPARSREEGKLAYWGLVAEATERRPDGGRAGWWHLTALGVRFVTNQARVPRYAYVYAGRCLGFHGEPVSIDECLGDGFDYDELMRGSDGD